MSNSRNLFLNEKVEDENIEDIIKSIISINEKDAEKLKTLKDFKIEPINLFINTFGGCVYNGFALMNAIAISKTPIHTIAIGSVMSMGLLIYLMGDKRYSTRFATFMQHEISGRMGGNLTDIKQSSDEWERLDCICTDIILEKTKINEEMIEDINSRKLDFFMDSKKAIELGVAQEILDELPF